MNRYNLRRRAVQMTLLGLTCGTWNSSNQLAQAGISYGAAESTYTENFNTLPFSPTNTSLGDSPNGWIDDEAAPAVDNFSIPGFHLWHPLVATGGGGHDRRHKVQGRRRRKGSRAKPISVRCRRAVGKLQRLPGVGA